MRTLLRIDASARVAGSQSRGLADHFQERWSAAHPDGRVIVRCLARDPVPHLDTATIAAFHAAPPPDEGRGAAAAALSDSLIAELESADDMLVSSALYNLGLPSVLKAYFDYVVRSGRTFIMDGGGYRGLLSGKSAFVVAARGGVPSPGQADDFQTPYLRAILSFVGIASIEVIPLDGTAAEEPVRSQCEQNARAHVDRLFARPSEPAWIGAFTSQDRREIGALRAAQAAAIERGDAEAYGQICSDDIALMIPGRDIISGRERFVACEQALFRSSRFASFRKTPERVERSGDLAVETGRQEVTTAGTSDAAGVSAARQKYTHVFRRTAEGWRFAVLMSNACP